MRPVIALALLAVAAISGFAVWKLRPQPKPRGESQIRSDYTLRDFNLVTLDEKGLESFTVKAPQLERDPKGKTLTLQLPEFSFPDKDGGRWIATSKTAWVAEKGVEVRLIEDVLMLGPPGASGARTRFNSAHLEVFPKRNLTQTDAEVTITRADSILRGKGMRTDMQTHHFQLLADVKGRYAPRRP
ncbi:MAG TPA: LPS export ABC transporter periplasmic protein LptC [Arenimonas sp.]|uniref:LPS export ABC transporter periplasmic protein LptC n=1 Tax=Arenimonas sp. TaxID=1872635 RepID=UPI002BA29D37|nr:LPS export ABC transporter periplasmic protein LptC [Arenimonas sp.]HMB56867.1 LPS export ABC transporter periplasmic protein LptC [Arenimonas sp.]